MLSDYLKGIKIKQLLPFQKEIFLKGLYLKHDLYQISVKLKRTIVVANYITDINDTIAYKDISGAPDELKNPYDWRLFQELQAQADVIITGSDYIKRFTENKQSAQNVLTQFEKNGEFEELGMWRLNKGCQNRSPDIAVLSRSIDFYIPNEISKVRKFLVFTSFKMTGTESAKRLEKNGIKVIGAGENGVVGNTLYDILGKRNYRVAKIVSGPRILKVFRDADKLDRLYITQVQKELAGKSSNLITVLLNEGKISQKSDFLLIERYLQKNFKTDDGNLTDQEFLVYENKRFREGINKSKA